jgi:photosystem II stability/assembly factor-like uncharacterized protein
MKKILLPLLLVFSFSLAVNAQNWTWSHQRPQGNTLNWVKVWNANTWYMAGANGTFMKTTNGGINWFITHKAGYPTQTGTGNYTLINSAWFFNMNTGYLACNVSGTAFSIMRTTNGGLTFDSVGTGTPTGASWNDIYFAGNHGFISGTTSGRFGKTTNGGLNWTVAGTGIASLPTGTYNTIFAWDSNKVIIGATLANIRTSTDGGATWTLTQASTGTTTLNKIRFMDANTGFAVGSSGAVWLSTNGGVNWTSTPTGNTSAYFDVVFKPSSNEVYVVGDAFNIYKSTNLGTNWTAVPFLAPVADQPWTSTYNSLSFAGDTLVTVGGSGLINRSTNNGVNWTTFTYYRKAGTLNDIWAESSNGKIWIVGAQGTSTVFDQVMYSSNGGANWTFQTTVNSTATFNSIDMINTSTGYIGGTTGRVRKTTNGGTSWDSVVTPFTFTINSINFFDANTGWVFGSTAGNIQKTTDGGATWTAQNAPGITAINASAVIDANTLFCVGTSGKFKRSTDGGTTWDSTLMNTTNALNDIDMINATTGYIGGAAGLLRRTTNGGLNWDTVTTPSTTAITSIDFMNTSNGWIVGTSGYTAKTSNGGQTWMMLNNGGGTPNAVVMTSLDTAYAVGGTGSVFKYTNFATGIEYVSEIPSDYVLSQNYPNPFNPSTTITFSIPRAGIVSLKVYDVAGREVNKLVDNFNFNAGRVNVTFDGSSLSSGVYFYSLIVDNNIVDTKKMMLIK